MYKEVCISIHELLIIGTAVVFILFVSVFLVLQNNKARYLNQCARIRDLEEIHQKDLFEVTIRTQEEERLRIGRNLHDDLGSSLATLRLAIDTPMYEYLNKPAFDLLKATCKKLLDSIISKVRTISHNLSPASLEIYGFLAAVEDMAEAVNNTGNLEIAINNRAGTALYKLEHNTALSLFRVLEELLANTIRHAGAGKVLLSFYMKDACLVIHYRDDGKGMDAAKPKGMGLHNIEKRLHLLQASYSITSSVNQGFSMEVSLNIV